MKVNVSYSPGNASMFMTSQMIASISSPDLSIPPSLGVALPSCGEPSASARKSANQETDQLHNGTARTPKSAVPPPVKRHRACFRINYPVLELHSEYGRSWAPILWPVNMDDGGNIDKDWASEMLRLRSLFFRDLGAAMYWTY